MNEGTKLLYADETYAIRGAMFEVYKEMGNAFDENVYQECMELALKDHGIPFEPQKKLPLRFKEHVLRHFYQPDLFCYGKIIVELKACSALADVHRAQLLNYLRITGSKLGLLVNFSAGMWSDVRMICNCISGPPREGLLSFASLGNRRYQFCSPTASFTVPSDCESSLLSNHPIKNIPATMATDTPTMMMILVVITPPLSSFRPCCV